mmetsp:Transcript_49484/g.123020  ORF Transcript_49484/g.123020 Transcript_49484/m.123020 type:complete len:317 (-) Transcript_49484:272-1222(-)
MCEAAARSNTLWRDGARRLPSCGAEAASPARRGTGGGQMLVVVAGGAPRRAFHCPTAPLTKNGAREAAGLARGLGSSAADGSCSLMLCWRRRSSITHSKSRGPPAGRVPSRRERKPSPAEPRPRRLMLTALAYSRRTCSWSARMSRGASPSRTSNSLSSAATASPPHFAAGDSLPPSSPSRPRSPCAAAELKPIAQRTCHCSRSRLSFLSPPPANACRRAAALQNAARLTERCRLALRASISASVDGCRASTSQLAGLPLIELTHHRPPGAHMPPPLHDSPTLSHPVALLPLSHDSPAPSHPVALLPLSHDSLAPS